MKKKIIATLLCTTLSLSLLSCGNSGVSQEDYEKLQQQEKEVSAELEETQGTLAALQKNYDSLETKYKKYKKKMKPYEEMEKAEVEARKAETEAKKAEAEAAAKTQELINDATDAVKKVWDFEKGTLTESATRELHDIALNKVNALTDETSKASLSQALVAASDALTQIEQAAAEAEAQRQAEASASVEQKNALSKAKSYLDFSSFSYNGLIEQLEYEGFSTESATYAVDNCGADWNEQAAKKAQSYMDFTSFSRESLIEQLEYEGFTIEQAEYGATTVGY